VIVVETFVLVVPDPALNAEVDDPYVVVFP
jgi:hypothetical protein